MLQAQQVSTALGVELKAPQVRAVVVRVIQRLPLRCEPCIIMFGDQLITQIVS